MLTDAAALAMSLVVIRLVRPAGISPSGYERELPHAGGGVVGLLRTAARERGDEALLGG